MTTTIQKWGNSQGIRLPKYLLDVLKWSDNEKITVETSGNSIIIKQAEKPKKRLTIAEMFEGYDGEYTTEEIDWGEPVGREVW